MKINAALAFLAFLPAALLAAQADAGSSSASGDQKSRAILAERYLVLICADEPKLCTAPKSAQAPSAKGA